jgi:hypothetical protein
LCSAAKHQEHQQQQNGPCCPKQGESRIDRGNLDYCVSPLSITHEYHQTNITKHNSELQKIITDMVHQHREETIKRDQAITSVQLQLENEKQKKQNSSVVYNLTVEVDGEKKARRAAEKRLQEELPALTSNHKTALTEHAAMYTKKFEDAWKAREDKEKRKAENEAAKVREKQEKLEQAKLEKRAKLQVQAKELNSGIVHLINRRQDGTLALTKDSEIPSKQTCLNGLTHLWNSHGNMISFILPHTLVSDLDAALEFEVEVIILARVYMLNLQLWGFEPAELPSTGWSSIAIDRFKNGLCPYHSDTELSNMSVAVCKIHQTLQQAVMNMHAGQLPVANYEQNYEQQAVPLNYSNNATTPQGLGIPGPYVPIQPSSTPIQPTFGPQVPTFMVTQATPPMRQTDTETWQANGAVVPTNQQLTAQRQVYVPDTIYKPPSPAMEKSKNICRNMKSNGACDYGPRCRFSHDIQVQPPSQNGAAPAGEINMSDLPANARVDGRATMPCNNAGRIGACKRPTCPYFHPPGTHIGDAPPITVQDNTWKPNQPVVFGANPAGKPTRPCRNEQDGGRCMMNSCIFSHQFLYGTNNEVSMSDAGNATFEGDGAGFNVNPMSANDKPCFDERDKGVATGYIVSSNTSFRVARSTSGTPAATLATLQSMVAWQV